jgi:tetratricopeptide (TPR) repeat protein
MKKIALYIIMALLAISIAIPAFSCTIVMYADGDKVLAGSNEDSHFRLTKIWFTPGTDKHFARVELGYDFGQNSVQGGMNEKGLFLDGNALGSQGWESDSTKPYAQGAFFDTLLATCETIEDVKKYFNTYNVPALNNARIPFMDASGASMVVEWYNGKVVFLETDKPYQIATNFVKSGVKDKDVTCWRYNNANKMMMNTNEDPLDLVRDALRSAHQNFKTNKTVYSFICDLKNAKIFVYNFFDFKNPKIYDLHKELKKGYTEYYLPNEFKHDREYKKFLKTGITDVSEFGYRNNHIGVATYFYKLHKDIYENELGLEVKPRDLADLAENIHKEGHPEHAEVLYRINTEEYPANFKVWFDYAKILEELGKRDETIAAYEKTLEIRPWCFRAKRALRR